MSLSGLPMFKNFVLNMDDVMAWLVCFIWPSKGNAHDPCDNDELTWGHANNEKKHQPKSPTNH